VLIALLPFVANPYLLFIGTLLSIFVILAVGLNLLVGYCGQLAFSNAAIFGIGAYGAGLLKVHLGWPFYFSVPAGAALATSIGLAMAFPALRLSGLYLALATLAFAQFTQWVFLHWEKVTFGAGGFRVAKPDFSFAGVSPDIGTFYVALVTATVLVLVASRLIRSRLGRAIIAVRDGEVAAESLGVDLLRYKALAFGLSAFYAGVAGGLNAMMLGFVAPETYDLFQMVLHKAMIVLGGMGSIAGSVIGAGIVLFLLEGLRAFKSAQEIAFGVVLLVCVLFAPAGIAGLLAGRLSSWKERYVTAGSAATPPPAEVEAPATGRTS
jgi:branched-chain amino acid transport system permease protein